MKLNLLPTYVSKEKSAKSAVIVMVLLILAGVVLAALMVLTSGSALAKAKQEATDLEPAAKRAVDTSARADAVIASAQTILRNIALADSMNKHNATYVRLYDEIMPYIPSYFRITSMSAAPVDGTTATLDLTGVLGTYQQYADLMLALLRIPGAVNVSRSGFTNIDPYIPGLTPEAQTSRPIRPGEQPIPDDPLARLDYFIARGSSEGFTGAGGFGTGTDGARGPMPNASQITVRVTLQRNLQTPDPQSTLAAQGSAGAMTAGAPVGGAPMGGPPMGGPPMGGGGPATRPAGGGGAGQEEDE